MTSTQGRYGSIDPSGPALFSQCISCHSNLISSLSLGLSDMFVPRLGQCTIFVFRSDNESAKLEKARGKSAHNAASIYRSDNSREC